MSTGETMQIGGETYRHQRLNTVWLRAAQELCDQTMGQSYYPLSSLQEIMEQPHHYYYLLIHSSGRLAGFHHHYLEPLNTAAIRLKLAPGAMLAVTGGEPDQPVGFCASLGIAGEFRQQGLAYALSQFSRDQLFALGATSLWVPAWKKNGVVPEAGTLLKQGFHFLCEVQRLWYDLEGLACPVCRQSHCICPADIYYQLKEPLSL